MGHEDFGGVDIEAVSEDRCAESLNVYKAFD